jgi:hypothetical protein
LLYKSQRLKRASVKELQVEPSMADSAATGTSHVNDGQIKRALTRRASFMGGDNRTLLGL